MQLLLRHATALVLSLSLLAVAAVDAGEWLGGQYWGQIAGCAHCGGSLYGGGLPPGAIWIGELGWGGGPSCGCEECHGGEVFENQDSGGTRGLTPSYGPESPPEFVVPEQSARRISYVLPATPVDRDFRPPSDAVRVITHTSQPERLQRAPLRIVSPDGSAGRMFR